MKVYSGSFGLCKVLATVMVLGAVGGTAVADIDSSRSENIKKITVEAFDAETRQTLEKFVLDFSSCGFKIYESDENGRFSMKAPESFSCYVQISKSGYSRTDLLIDSKAIEGEERIFTVYLSRSSNLFAAQVRDRSKRNLYIPKAQVFLRSALGDERQETESMQGGKFELLLLPGQRYVLEVVHPAYNTFRTYLEPNVSGEFVLNDIFLEPKSETGAVRGKWSAGKIRDHRDEAKTLRHYSIQVGASSNPDPDISNYQDKLHSFGEVYIQRQRELSRIKVGRFYSRADAEHHLGKIRALDAFREAFITQTLVTRKPKETTVQAKNETSDEGIMIRLASYLNPQFFEQTKVAHLGTVRLLEKDEWRIAVLEGFESVDAARKACAEAKTLGFSNAHMVRFDSGELRRLE